MTPLPSAEELRRRPKFNPAPGTIHVRDLIKLNTRYKHHLSDHIIGILVHAGDIGLRDGGITKTEGDEFMTPFARGLKIRRRIATEHMGLPFLGPDCKVLVIQGIALDGGHPNFPRSPLTFDTLVAHPGYAAWLSYNLYAGGVATSNNSAVNLPIPYAYFIGNVNPTTRPLL